MTVIDILAVIVGMIIAWRLLCVAGRIKWKWEEK